MPLSSKTISSQTHLQPGRQTAHRINRRTLLKGVGGIAATSFVGGGAVIAGSAPAQAALNVAQHEDQGRMQYYKLATPSIGWLPRVNVLLPDGYDATRRYPVLYLLHGGGETTHPLEQGSAAEPMGAGAAGLEVGWRVGGRGLCTERHGMSLDVDGDGYGGADLPPRGPAG